MLISIYVLLLASIQLLSVQAQCPAPFSQEAGRCVFGNTSHSLSWCSANRQCASIGGQLMSSFSSLQQVSNMSSMNCSNCRLWIGGSDLADERVSNKIGWRMTNGDITQSTSDLNWGSSNPNNGGGKEDCLSYNGLIFDFQCSLQYGFACEFAPAAPYKPVASASWQRTPFRRTSYNPSSEYCYSDLDVANHLECMAAAMKSGISRHVLYNSGLGKCRQLQFTDAQVEEAIETSADWVKFSAM